MATEDPLALAEVRQQLDPAYCTQCGRDLNPGHMVCPGCGTTALRTRYPMVGDWNRRLSGVAVSGWGWSLYTGTLVHVFFNPSGLTVQQEGTTESRRWGEISEMAVTGPGTESRQGYALFPILDLTDPAGTAINLGLQYLVGKATTTTSTRTLFSVAGPGFELVVFSDGVDTRALRWQLAPAFSAWRRTAYEYRLLAAQGRQHEVPPVAPTPKKDQGA